MKPFRPAGAPTATLFRSLRAASSSSSSSSSSFSSTTSTLTASRPSIAQTTVRTYRSLRPRLRLPALLRSLRSSPPRRFASTKTTNSSAPKPNPTPHLGSPDPVAPSLSQRLRRLSREYGWVALGVYLGLSVLDFPFCFLAVRMLGTDRIGRWEHAVIQAFWRAVHVVAPNLHPDGRSSGEEGLESGSATAREGALGHSEEVVQAELRNSGVDATIWTQLALAYAIHKSFIFLRVPLTAAVTPKVVKVLRGWGWNIGKKKPKA